MEHCSRLYGVDAPESSCRTRAVTAVTRPVAKGWLCPPAVLFCPQLSQPQLLAVADENLYAPHCPSLPPAVNFWIRAWLLPTSLYAYSNLDPWHKIDQRIHNKILPPNSFIHSTLFQATRPIDSVKRKYIS
jgi:hypothetical protein